MAELGRTFLFLYLFQFEETFANSRVHCHLISRQHSTLLQCSSLAWKVDVHQVLLDRFLQSATAPPCVLADEEGPKEAALLIHVHGGGVGHGDKEAVSGVEGEEPPLVGRVQRKLRVPGPAGGPAGLHQQDGNRVAAHLRKARRKKLINPVHKFHFYFFSSLCRPKRIFADVHR